MADKNLVNKLLLLFGLVLKWACGTTELSTAGNPVPYYESLKAALLTWDSVTFYLLPPRLATFEKSQFNHSSTRISLFTSIDFNLYRGVISKNK